MNKQKLVKFIDKYNLGGLVNSAILSFKDNTLNTRFTSGDKSLLGILSMDNWDFEDGEFGHLSGSEAPRTNSPGQSESRDEFHSGLFQLSP